MFESCCTHPIIVQISAMQYQICIPSIPDHLHLSIEAQCVSHLLPLGDRHISSIGLFSCKVSSGQSRIHSINKNELQILVGEILAVSNANQQSRRSLLVSIVIITI